MSEAKLIDLGWKKRALTFLLGCAIGPLRLVNALFTRRTGKTRFLILEPFGLGDVISLEPLVRALRTNAEVMICAKDVWRTLYPGVEWIDAAVPWSSYDPNLKYGWRRYLSGDFLNFIRQLRRRAKGSVGIDSRGDIRSVLLLYLVGCRKVCTLSFYLGSNLKNPSWVGQIVPFRCELRRWENNLQFARLLGRGGAPTSGPQFEHLGDFSEGGSRAKVVGFVPVAPWEGKLWSPEKWSDLAGRLRAQGWEVRILCGPEQRHSAATETGTKEELPFECDSIPKWAEQLKQLSVLVSLDSGPMHLADALGVPVIALFGQGMLPLWAPSGTKSRTLNHQKDPDFHQCHPIPANAAFAREFMNRITVDEVLNQIQEIKVL